MSDTTIAAASLLSWLSLLYHAGMKELNRHSLNTRIPTDSHRYPVGIYLKVLTISMAFKCLSDCNEDKPHFKIQQQAS